MKDASLIHLAIGMIFFGALVRPSVLLGRSRAEKERVKVKAVENRPEKP